MKKELTEQEQLMLRGLAIQAKYKIEQLDSIEDTIAKLIGEEKTKYGAEFSNEFIWDVYNNGVEASVIEFLQFLKTYEERENQSS